MKHCKFYLLLLAVLFVAASCQKEDNEPEPVRSMGISFTSDASTLDLNTENKTATLEITVNGDITKEDLTKRFKLSYNSAEAKEGTHYKIKSTEILENPLRAVVQVEALPSLARTNQVIEITFDATMQPITLGNISKYTLTIAPYAPVRTWHKDATYHAPFVYYYDKSTAKWTNVAGHFSSVPGDDAAVIGFENKYVTNSGVPLFNMHRIYATEIAGTVGGSVTAAHAKINVPKVLEFIPAAPGAKQGTVKVLPQDVVVTRKDNSTFKIGISGAGTYNEETKLIDLVVDFNETAIGGPAKVSYTYKLSSEKLTL